jgi:hypothetical protein
MNKGFFEQLYEEILRMARMFGIIFQAPVH